MLLVLTLLAAAAFVLVLAGYLVAIAWTLTQAQRNVARLADAFEAVARATEPLGDAIAEADRELARMTEDVAAAGAALAGVADAIEQRRTPAAGG